MIVQDFVEAPSQMLENWTFETSILQRVSAHVETGEPLPEDLSALQCQSLAALAESRMQSRRLSSLKSTTKVSSTSASCSSVSAFLYLLYDGLIEL